MQQRVLAVVTWMKTEGGGLVLAVVTWAAVMALCMVDWINGSQNINRLSLEVTPYNLVWVTCLFLLFIVGYFIHGDIFLKHNRKQFKTYGLLLSAIACGALCVVFHFGLIGILQIIIVGQLPRILSLKKTMFVALTLPFLGASISYIVTDESFLFENALLFSLFNTFATLSSHRFMMEQAEKLKSQQLVRELKATQLLLTNTSKRDERMRVARDLHDSLGHNLTALCLQLEVASHKQTEQVQEHISQAKSIANNLLTDVRKTVSNMRHTQDFQLERALKILTNDIPNLQVTRNIDINCNELSIALATTVFSCIQEALTNVIKHANASQCWITLCHADNNIVLSVQDNGLVTTPIHFGNGLSGMLERIQQFNGKMTATNSHPGCLLNINLPWQGH